MRFDLEGFLKSKQYSLYPNELMFVEQCLYAIDEYEKICTFITGADDREFTLQFKDGKKCYIQRVFSAENPEIVFKTDNLMIKALMSDDKNEKTEVSINEIVRNDIIKMQLTCSNNQPSENRVSLYTNVIEDGKLITEYLFPDATGTLPTSKNELWQSILNQNNVDVSNNETIDYNYNPFDLQCISNLLEGLRASYNFLCSKVYSSNYSKGSK